MSIEVYSEAINKVSNNRIYINILLSAALFFVFLIFNPFIALFIISILSVYVKIPKISFLIIAGLAFTLFFFFRKYDVTWSESSDDVPTYILLFFSNKALNFFEIFTRFIEMPGNNEPLWHLPFWVLLNVFGGGEKSFVFFHYLFIFIVLFYSLISISNRYYVILILAYFFLSPVALDSVFHIWRQQLASSIFLIGCNTYLNKKRKFGMILIFSSALVHLICIFFIIIFFYFNFLRKRGLLNNKLFFLFYSLLLSFILIITFNVGLNFIASLNLERVLMYAETSGSSQIRLLIVMSMMMGTIFISHIYFKNDNLNMLFIFMTVVVTTMSIAFPNATSIFGRLAYFTVPLMGLYFIRWFILNLNLKWLPLVVIFIFITGLIRIIPLITEERASSQFLAFGNPLDPFMGLIKMIYTF